MKEYECVEVNHHKKITKVTQEYTKNGWCIPQRYQQPDGF